MREPGTKRKQQAWKTRNSIISNAFKLFEEDGFSNVSVEMIAEASNISTGAIYHYFSSKDEIAAHIVVLLDEQYEKFFDELMNGEKYKNLSSIEKLEEYFIFVQVKCSELSSLNFAYIHNLRNTESEILAVNKKRVIYQNYSKLLQFCREDRTFPAELSDEYAIRILTQISRGLLVDWMLQNKEFDILKQARILVKTVIAGIGEGE